MRIHPCFKFLSAGFLFAGCSVGVGGFSWSLRQAGIGRVKQGDTLWQVERKIGKPHEVITDETTVGGHHKLVCGYQAVYESEHSASGGLRAPARYPVLLQEKSQMNFGASDYLVVFIDGKVDSVIYR